MADANAVGISRNRKMRRLFMVLLPEVMQLIQNRPNRRATAQHESLRVALRLPPEPADEPVDLRGSFHLHHVAAAGENLDREVSRQISRV